MSESPPIGMREGVRWAHRLLLNREPESDATIARMASAVQSAEQLRALIVGSPAFRDLAESVDRRYDEPPPSDVDFRAGIAWGFRLILGREPSEADIAALLPHIRSVRTLREAFILSRECELRNDPSLAALRDFEIISRFAPFCTTPAPRGWWNDFLGVRTRCDYLPRSAPAKSATVERPPGCVGGPMHDLAEWVGTLKSAMEARGSLVAVELGAGWAPWLVACGVLARRLGIEDVCLMGVEGSLTHLEFARQHFADNGLDVDAHRLMHAVVGAHEGVARFPRLAASVENYGAHADFAAGAPHGVDMEEIPCVSIGALLGEIPKVDILHCDIQGAETAALYAAKERLTARVRRVVVGTHSRRIDADLLDLFSGMAWVLEHETPCAVTQRATGDLLLTKDGVQVWRNESIR